MLTRLGFSLLLCFVAAQNDCDNNQLCEVDSEALLAWSFSDTQIDCNDLLTPEEAAPEPLVTWDNGEADVRYFLLGIDPDAPSCEDPSRKWVRHWLIGDLTAEQLADGDFSQADVNTAYRGPNPPAGSGPHRYQFMVHVQPTEAFSDMELLPGPGDPIAGWDAAAFLAANSVGEEDYVASFQYRAERPAARQ